MGGCQSKKQQKEIKIKEPHKVKDSLNSKIQKKPSVIINMPDKKA